MATKIYTANIFIGDPDKPMVLENQIVKKLPIHINLSDTLFLDRIKSRIGEKNWNALKKLKKDKRPEIRIHFIKQVGTVNQEPEIL